MSYKQLKPDHIEYIVVHASATPADMDIGREEIDRWHRQKGYFMVGYHYIIRRSGLGEIGREVDRFGAHALGYNQRSLGVCLVGGVKRVKDRDGKNDADGPRWDMVPENNFTQEQFVTLKKVLMGLIAYATKAKVVGHRDLPHVKKACPCFDVESWMESVNL